MIIIKYGSQTAWEGTRPSRHHGRLTCYLGGSRRTRTMILHSTNFFNHNSVLFVSFLFLLLFFFFAFLFWIHPLCQPAAQDKHNLQNSFGAVSEQFQSSFRVVSEHFQSIFRAISEQFQINAIYRAVSEQFQSSFRAVSEQFQTGSDKCKKKKWKKKREILGMNREIVFTSRDLVRYKSDTNLLEIMQKLEDFWTAWVGDPYIPDMNGVGWNLSRSRALVEQGINQL